MKKMILLMSILAQASFAYAVLPEPPTEAQHPGSLVYPYEFTKEQLSISGRNVDVFMPVGVTNVPVIAFGHGQALDVEHYELTFEHLAKKGYAVVHPQYDKGFFDQDWKRMGRDYAMLVKQTIDRYSEQMNQNAIVFSGHSKGAYIALNAAGIPASESPLRPHSVVVFNLAGYERDWIKNIDVDIPITLTWSVADSVIKESLVREAYSQLPSVKKQLITLQSYSSRSADHFFSLSKSSFFGGVNGISPFHYYGTWKWLIGAADDIVNKAGQTNQYIYGEDSTKTGSNFKHSVERTWSDMLIFFEEQADLSGASKITDRVERIQYVYDRLRSTAKRSQASLQKLLQAKAYQIQPFYISNAILVKSITRESLQSLVQNYAVRSILPNTPAALTDTTTTLDYFRTEDSYPKNITKINVHQVWEQLNVRGKGIVIAGQDTGYDWEHPAIRSQYRGIEDHNYNWYDATSDASPTPVDDNGHGTHTMGSMVGDGGVNKRIGVAPEAQWIGCRNMKGGVGTPSTYMSCFQFFLAPFPVGGDAFADGRPEMAPHIVNNSWSCPPNEGCEGEELLGSVQAMRAAGIFVVVAAGNDGSRCESVINPPATYSSEVFSVGALNTYTDEIAWFSSRGPSARDGGLGVHLVAPGAPVNSSVPGGGYESKMGTSMASPHVAGATALLWSYQPDLVGDIDATIDRLQRTASPKKASQSCGTYKGSDVPNVVWGHGILDALSLLTK